MKPESGRTVTGRTRVDYSPPIANIPSVFGDIKYMDMSSAECRAIVDMFYNNFPGAAKLRERLEKDEEKKRKMKNEAVVRTPQAKTRELRVDYSTSESLAASIKRWSAEGWWDANFFSYSACFDGVDDPYYGVHAEISFIKINGEPFTRVEWSSSVLPSWNHCSVRNKMDPKKIFNVDRPGLEFKAGIKHEDVPAFFSPAIIAYTVLVLLLPGTQEEREKPESKPKYSEGDCILDRVSNVVGLVADVDSYLNLAGETCIIYYCLDCFKGIYATVPYYQSMCMTERDLDDENRFQLLPPTRCEDNNNNKLGPDEKTLTTGGVVKKIAGGVPEESFFGKVNNGDGSTLDWLPQKMEGSELYDGGYRWVVKKRNPRPESRTGHVFLAADAYPTLLLEVIVGEPEWHNMDQGGGCWSYPCQLWNRDGKKNGSPVLRSEAHLLDEKSIWKQVLSWFFWTTHSQESMERLVKEHILSAIPDRNNKKKEEEGSEFVLQLSAADCLALEKAVGDHHNQPGCCCGWQPKTPGDYVYVHVFGDNNGPRVCISFRDLSPSSCLEPSITATWWWEHPHDKDRHPFHIVQQHNLDNFKPGQDFVFEYVARYDTAKYAVRIKTLPVLSLNKATMIVDQFRNDYPDLDAALVVCNDAGGVQGLEYAMVNATRDDMEFIISPDRRLGVNYPHWTVSDDADFKPGMWMTTWMGTETFLKYFNNVNQDDLPGAGECRRFLLAR